jgi:hypothetical protein
LVINGKELQKFQSDVLKELRQAFELRATSHVIFQKVVENSRSTVEDFELVGGSTDLEELAEDNRGQARHVIPIQRIKDWTVLLGLRFSWRKSSAKYQYVSSQIILFLSSTATEEPRQFLRLEWEGVRSDGTFEASHAAHPHWQVDIIPRPATAAAIADDPFPDLEIDLAARARPAASRLPHWLPQIHFAAAADWAEITWSGEADSSAHAAGPEHIDDLLRWTSSACSYLNAQLGAALAGS